MADEMIESVGSEVSPAPVATPQGDNAAPATGVPQTPSSAATPTEGAQPPATGGESGAMVPSYRIRETREAVLREAQKYIAQRESEYQARLEEMDRKLKALVGVVPEQTSEEDLIKQQFAKVFPGLAKLQDKADILEQLIGRAGDLESQTTHYWQSYGQQQMDRLFSKAEAALGGTLSEKGKNSLHKSLVGYLQSSPELAERYATDPTFIDEFWEDFSSSFIEPVRRTSATTAVTRATTPLPQDTPSGPVRTTPAEKPADLDERTKMAWVAFKANNKK